MTGYAVHGCAWWGKQMVEMKEKPDSKASVINNFIVEKQSGLTFKTFLNIISIC